MKIITVVGARPQLVKEAILQEEIRKYSDISHIFVHTGQHYDFEMSDIFIQQMSLKQPDYFLGINRKTNITSISLMMIELEKVYIKHTPDFVIVYGDTDSTLAAALTAKKMNIKVVHIEAGLRQEPKSMPEEVNRVLTDHVSTVLFTSSEVGTSNLNFEGIHKNIYNVGDIMYDVFLRYSPQFKNQVLSEFNLEDNNYLLFTLHRNFNVDIIHSLENILIVMNEVNRHLKVVFPIHPRTLKMIEKYGLNDLIKNLVVIQPQNYINLMSLVKFSTKVVTDSGGLQKEAYFSEKNALVLMEDTGWRELIDKDYNRLIDVNTNFVDEVLGFSNPIADKNIYGEGSVQIKVLKILRELEGLK